MGAGHGKHTEKELCFQLHTAITDGDEELAKELLLCGAVDPNSKTFTQNKKLEHPLISAIENNLPDLVDLLIENNASVNILDTSKKTPLHIAVVQNLLDICATLIDNNADISAVNIHGDSSLHLAATYNLVNMALLLIRYGADVNCRGYEGRTPLHSASCIPGNVCVMQVLLESNSDANLKDTEERTPLHHVAQLGNVQSVELLLSYNVDINGIDSYGKTALHLAVENEELPTARVLVRNGCQINSQDKDGKTALLIATKKQYDDIVLFLLDSGADANIASYAGVVPLRSAVWNKNITSVQHLLMNGALVNASDHTGVTPLHVACLYVGADVTTIDKQLIELLLSNGANVNARSSKNGGTPLHCSVEVGNEEICAMLLRYGADPSIKDMKDKTPLSYSTSTDLSHLLATSIPEHVTSNGRHNDLVVALPETQINVYSPLLSNQNCRRRSSEDISLASKSSMSDITGSLPNHHQDPSSPPPIPKRDFTMTPPLIPVNHLSPRTGVMPMQGMSLHMPTPMFSPWQPTMISTLPAAMMSPSPTMHAKIRNFQWSSQSDDSTEISSVSSNNKRSNLTRLDVKSLLSFSTNFPTKKSAGSGTSVCFNVNKTTLTKGCLNTNNLGCLLDISVAAVSNNILLYAQSANEHCYTLPRRSNWTQCSNIVHFYTQPSATLRHPDKYKKAKHAGGSSKENVTFRKPVLVKFPLRSGATHQLSNGEKEVVILASFDNGRSWEDMETRVDEVTVDNSPRKKSSSGKKKTSPLPSSVHFAVTSTKELVMFVAMIRPIITVKSIGPDGGKIMSPVCSTMFVNLATGIGRNRDIEMEAEKVSSSVIDQLQGKGFPYLAGSSRILHLNGFCSPQDTINQPLTIHMPCHLHDNQHGNSAITYRILMQEMTPPSGDYRDPYVSRDLGLWKDVTEQCTDVQLLHRGKKLLGGSNSNSDGSNVTYDVNVTTARALFMVVAVRSFTSSLSRHIIKIPTNILQINRSYQVYFMVHQKASRESHAVFTIAHKRDADKIREQYQHNSMYKGQKRLSVPQVVYEQQNLKVRISGGVKFSGKSRTFSSKHIVLHSGLLPMNEKFIIESTTCNYNTDTENIGFLEFSDADKGLAGARLSILEGGGARSPLPSDSSVLVLENKNFSSRESSKGSKPSSPQPSDQSVQEKPLLLASLPLVLPRQEPKIVLPPSDALNIISDSLLHQVVKNMDELELKELGFQLGISQEKINISLLPLNNSSSANGTLSRQTSFNVEEIGVKLLQEWQTTAHHEDAVTQLCDALRSIGRDNLAHDIKKLCTPFTVEDSGLSFQNLEKNAAAQ